LNTYKKYIRRTNNIKLYELTAQYQELLDLIESGEIEEDVGKDTLEAINDAIETKVVNIAKVIKHLEYDTMIVKVEKDRMAIKQKSIERNRDNLKNYLYEQLLLIKDNKVKTPTITVSLKKNPPAVEVDDVNLIPNEYFIVIPEDKKLDKDSVKKAIKDGEEVPGARLVQGMSVNIK
jgi:hypothetical protein